jgi:hypothetical protein
MNFKKYISETYSNFIGSSDITLENKKKWADRVWGMLQRAYEDIGGIKGSGFLNKEDMIDNIPFWKIFHRGEHLIAVVMYKDARGRKLVATGTDRSQQSKKILSNIFKEALKVSYGEYSGKLLSAIVKNVSYEKLEPYLLDPLYVKKLLDKEIYPPDPEKLNLIDLETYNKFPRLHKYFYMRDFNGKSYLKICLGTPELFIK